MKNAEQALGIVEVLRVVDTREFVETADDRWVPIPGSGIENECARCGRLHEIHASVRLADGSETVVGVGCMKADSLEVQERARSLAGAATRKVKLAAQLAAARANLARGREIAARAEAEFVFAGWTSSFEASNGAQIPVLHGGHKPDGQLVVDEAQLWDSHGRNREQLWEELRRTAKGEHVRGELKRAGLRACLHSLATEVSNLEDRVARAEKAR